jgi:membrane-associated phospholipid phosphatase
LISFPNTRGRGIEVHDLASAALFFLFSLFSFVWPKTGLIKLGSLSLARGYIMAPLLLALGFLALSLGRFDFSRAPSLVRFVRRFYPQAFFGPLFSESILLSAQVSGGGSNDALFAGADMATFGFQPAREFSRALEGFPVWNEIMFAAYFVFYVMLVITPWIPYFKGDEKEAEREVSILSLYMLFIYVFYVFFRVEGPKYWLPDLHAAWYSHFKGGFFVAFFTKVFSKTELSGAAFPSSHVAVALMMTFFVAKTKRNLLPLYSGLSLLVAAATVYIYAHWAADVVGGALTAFALLPFLDRLRQPVGDLCLALDERLGPSGEGLPEGHLPKKGA